MTNNQSKVELGGYNLKEISLILLLSMVVVVTAIVAIGLAIAITNDTSEIKFSGTFDLGQYQAIVIGIAFVATVLVAQQLTSKNQAKAIADNDAIWSAEELAKIEAKTKALIDTPLVDLEDKFFEDNRDDNLEEDAVVEVPPGKGEPSVTGAANADPTKLQFLADRTSWKNEIKTVDGKPVVLVGSQSSRRSKKKRTIYVYHIVGTNILVYNRSRYGIFFMRMAVREENIQNFFEVFIQPPLTDKERDWLARYDYQLV